MASDTVSVVASFVPRAGSEDDVERILRAMVEPSRSEEGCTRYDLYRSPDGFHLIEGYRDPSALDSHRQTEHYRDYRATIADHLDGEIGVLKLEPLDVAT